MKSKDRDLVIHLCWAWITLFLNVVIATITVFVFKRDSELLVFGLIGAFCALGAGVTHISRSIDINEIRRESFTLGDIVGQYIPTYIVSFIIAYYTYSYSSISGAVIVIVAIIIEFIISLMIQYKYKLRKFFLKKNKKR